MGIYIKGMKMPEDCFGCPMVSGYEIADEARTMYSTVRCRLTNTRRPVGEAIASDCPLVPVPPHGDLIDRDALMKDGWLNLHKEVMRMGGYAVHELPLINPSISVVIPAEEEKDA